MAQPRPGGYPGGWAQGGGVGYGQQQQQHHGQQQQQQQPPAMAAYQQHYQAYQQAQQTVQRLQQQLQQMQAAGQQPTPQQQQQLQQAYQAQQMAMQRAQQAQQQAQQQTGQPQPGQGQPQQMRMQQRPPQQGGSLEVYTVGSDGDEVVVKTLVGEYVERSANHGRKVYQKVLDKSANSEAVDVFLYYWDGRDGPSFEGWWFGNQLGGSQVWSHCNSSDMAPPTTGWKIPWDGAVRSSIVLAAKSGPAVHLTEKDVEDRLRACAMEVQKFEGPARQALEQAKASVGDYSHAAGVMRAEQLLGPYAAPLSELIRRLLEVQKFAQGEHQKSCGVLIEQIRAVHGGLTTELAKVREVKGRVETDARQQAAEQRDGQILQEVLPEATAKCHRAVDFTEKAVITSEMIAAAGENVEEVQRGIAETEAAARQAQAAIGDARIFLNAKQASVKRFESPKIANMAQAEFAKLQQQLQDAQNKLNPLKNARQDFMQRQAARRMIQELLAMLGPAEVDCDRAEEAAALLNGEEVTKETLSTVEQAVRKANDSVSNVMRLIEQRKAQAGGATSVVAELTQLGERATAAEARLQGSKNVYRENAERVTCGVLLKEAAEKLQAVQDAVAKACDSEGPFLMGVEELPVEDTMKAVKACETGVTSANTSVSICRMFLATKVVEAKRFTERLSQETTVELKENQKQLEGLIEKLQRLKKATGERKAKALMREAEEQVAAAEALAKKVAEAASLFDDDEKLFAASSEEIKTAGAETTKAEGVANAALAEARKYITARQIEAKGREASVEVSTELIKFQTRLSSAQGEVQKWKRMVGMCEQRLAGQKAVEEGKKRIEEASDAAKKVTDMVAALGEEDDAAVEAAEKRSSEVQEAVKAVWKYLEDRALEHSAAAADLLKLHPSLKEVQDRVAEFVSVLRERSEKRQVKAVLVESEEKVKEAEDAAERVGKGAFFGLSPDVPLHEASQALADVEAALQEANTIASSAKTFIAMKRLAIKRLAESVTESAFEELNKLASRVEDAIKSLGDLKTSMAEKKHGTVKREINAKIAEVEECVDAAKQATLSLISGEDTKDPDKMKAACEKAGGAQAKAVASLEETKKAVVSRQREAKANGLEQGPLMELAKIMEQLGGLQSQLDNLKSTLRDQEHKFVAGRLLQDASEKIEALEKSMESLAETASPLQSENFIATHHLSLIVDALLSKAKEASMSGEALFAELAAGKDTLTVEAFSEHLGKMPELCEHEDSIFMPEELEAAYARLSPATPNAVTKEEFLAKLRKKYVCTAVVAMTDALVVRGGKTVRKLAKMEVVEELAPAEKEPSLGLMRVKARAEQDQKEGYVTLAGNQGTVYFQSYSAFFALEHNVEKGVTELMQAMNSCMTFLDQKIEELRGVKAGPLADTRAEMNKMRPRVNKVQTAQIELKRRLAEAVRDYKHKLEGEKSRRQDAKDRKAARRIVESDTETANGLAEQVAKALSSAEAMTKTKGAESSLQAITDVEREIQELLVNIEKAISGMKATLEAVKTTAKGPMAEARTALVKLKVRMGAHESKCQRTLAALRSVKKQLEEEARDAVVGALRSYAAAEGLGCEELFEKLSEGKEEIPAEEMRSFMTGLEGAPPEAAVLACFPSALSKLGLRGLLQEYLRCVKEITVTTALEIKDCKTVRKLAVGETVEVLEAAKQEATGLLRAKCRPLLDGKEGFVTVRGNKDTAYLEKCEKPYVCCESEVEATEGFETSSDAMKRLRVGEVLEVLEGPRKEEPTEVYRLRGSAKSDGAWGWVTQKDAAGRELLESKKLLVCVQSVAITTDSELTETVRKLDAGEVLEPLEEPETAGELTRQKVKAVKDGAEGWATVRGNQGTDFLQESDRLYVCTRAVSLEAKFASDSKAVRTLQEGEVFEANDWPRPESREAASRLKGRSIVSGEECWVTLAREKLSPWCPRYKCDSGTTLTEGQELASATLRKVEPGEVLEALEAPLEDEASGALRVRLRAEKDGAVGYGTIRGSQGLPFLYTLAAA